MNARETQYDSDEHRLVARAAGGDRAAFKAVYQRYSEQIFNLIYYWLGDQLAAEDVLQIVFMKVYRGLGSFRFESSFSTWIYRIALNECQNQSRRAGARYVPFDAILGSGEEFDQGPLPDHQHAIKERQEILSQALMELPPKFRAVVVLKYQEGLSYAEIAAIMQCSTGTVASRLSRALAQLEKQLRPLRRLL
jgi:RNA polymerase sigma-70 factor (ECF subfamily)